MSFNSDCSCVCPDPTTVEIPGSPGEDGAAGAAGTDGISAFTLLTSNLTIPASEGDPVSMAVAENSWVAVGQVLLASDGADVGTFLVTGTTGSTIISATWMDAPDDDAPGSVIGSGGKVVCSGQPGEVTSPLPIANGGTNATTVQTALTNLGLGFTPLAVYAAGTAYSLTATQALLNFGTTDPSLTLTSPGVYVLFAKARVDYNAKTTAAVRTITLKLRRTNNTAADIANATTSVLSEIVTTLTYTLCNVMLPLVVYTTTNSDDIIQMFGAADDIAGAGTFDATEASIVAVKIFNQTL